MAAGLPGKGVTPRKRRGQPAAGKRLKKEEWIGAAIGMMLDNGPNAVTIVELAATLGVTKGSFYWHFESRDELLDLVLEHWFDASTREVIRHVESKGSTSLEKLRILAHIATSPSKDDPNSQIEMSIRDWSRRNSKARDVLLAVDQDRIRYIEDLFSDLSISRGKSRVFAEIYYGMCLGERIVVRPGTARSIADRIDHNLDQLVELMIPGSKGSAK